MQFIFNEAQHRYFLGSRELPGVNSILKEIGLIDDRFFTDMGKIRGRAVHKGVDLLIRNRLDFASLHPEVEGHIFAVQAFMLESGFSPILELCEKPQYHPVYLYAGTPDLVGRLNGRVVVIDVKTGSVSPIPGNDKTAADMQIAAYYELPEIKRLLPDRFILKTENNGRYKLDPRPDTAELFNVFLSGLNIHYFKNKRSLLSCSPQLQ